MALAVLLGAGCGPGTEGTETGEQCAESRLVEQCPPGSNPTLGATAESLCGASVEGSLVTQEGAVSGQCYGEGACRVACQFESPCRCGVDRITREGVFCTPCDEAPACGDAVCSDGESPETCEADCGVRCEPPAMRCDGAAVQSCTMQGYWDTLPCPANEVCVEVASGQVNCARDGSVIDLDARDATEVVDGQETAAGGRIVLGDGAYHGTSDGPTHAGPAPAFSRVVASGVAGADPDPFDSQLLLAEQIIPLDEATTLAFCHRDRGCVAQGDWAPRVEAADYCAALAACTGVDRCQQHEDGEIFGLHPYDDALVYGAPVMHCMFERYTDAAYCAGSPSPYTETAAQPCIAALRAAQTQLFAPAPEGAARDFEAVSSDARVLIHTEQPQGGGAAALWTRQVSDWTPRARLDALPHGFAPARFDENAAGDAVALLQDAAGNWALLVWGPEDSAPQASPWTPPYADTRVLEVVISPNGRHAAVAVGEYSAGVGNYVGRSVHLIDLESGDETLRVLDASVPVRFSPRDGALLAGHQTSGAVDVLELWDLEGLRKLGELSAAPFSVAIHPSGQQLAALTYELELWDLDTFTRQRVVDVVVTTGSQARSVHYSPGGERLLTNSGGSFSIVSD